MKKLYSLLLAFVLITVLVVPVKAASNDSGWIELLERVSIQDNGENIFRMGQSYTLSIPTPQEMRLRKIDMLIRVPAPHPITSATCTVNSTTTTLEVLKIGDNLVRIIGALPDATYEAIKIKLGRSGTSSQPYEVLSCKVTPLYVQEFVCSASVYFGGVTYPTNYHIDVTAQNSVHAATSAQFRIDVSDSAKYDSLSVWGSSDGLSIDSIRASLGTTSLAITVNYIQFNDAGSWTEFVFESDPAHDYALESGASLSTPFYGKYLYNIEIDLSNIDRISSARPLYVYITGHYDSYYGATFNCQYVNGRVTTADTSNVTWWQRFTNFMTDLFGEGKGQDLVDDLNQSSDSISQGASDIHSFEQSQQAVLDSALPAIQSAVSFTSFSASLLFVQRYANLTVLGISKYMVVFTLPLFLGLFFYLCSRVPGITRWKSRPPQKKGGKNP